MKLQVQNILESIKAIIDRKLYPEFVKFSTIYIKINENNDDSRVWNGNNSIINANTELY